MGERNQVEMREEIERIIKKKTRRTPSGRRVRQGGLGGSETSYDNFYLVRILEPLC